MPFRLNDDGHPFQNYYQRTDKINNDNEKKKKKRFMKSKRRWIRRRRIKRRIKRTGKVYVEEKGIKRRKRRENIKKTQIRREYMEARHALSPPIKIPPPPVI